MARMARTADDGSVGSATLPFTRTPTIFSSPQPKHNQTTYAISKLEPDVTAERPARHHKDAMATSTLITNISEKQLAANRANARRSTGPVTAEGKSRVAGNRLTHGLAVSRHVILPNESQADYDALLEAFLDEFAPASTFEQVLVHQIAEAHWKLRRVGRQEAEFLAKHPNPFLEDAGKGTGPARTIGQISRYEAAARRAFHKAIEDLRRHQADRRKHQQLRTETTHQSAFDGSKPFPAERVEITGPVERTEPDNPAAPPGDSPAGPLCA
jgi:hypothetical protein